METHSQTLIKLIREFHVVSFAEIGVNVGDNAVAILEACYDQLRMIYLIDPYRQYNDGTMGGQDQKLWDNDYQRAAERLSKWTIGRGARAHLWRVPSVSAAERLPDYVFDLVFIDGAHDRLSVIADINAWSTKIAPRGHLVGHDFKSWPEVRPAVLDRFPESRVTTPDPHGNIWMVQL